MSKGGPLPSPPPRKTSPLESPGVQHEKAAIFDLDSHDKHIRASREAKD